MERTIPHLDEGTIQALVHGELTSTAAADATRHAAGCADCRAEVARARAEDAWAREQLSALDATPPAPDYIAVMHQSHPRASSGTWRRVAAIALLVGGAGIAWALPAVRTFVGRVVDRPTTGQAPGRLRVATPDSTPGPASAGGIAVRPGARFAVSFEASQSRGEIRIRLEDANELTLVASGGNVPLESRLEELVVSNRGAIADYELTIPSGAPMVEVRVAGVRRFLKQGTTTIAPGAEPSGGRYLISLRP